jgi:hypothetical protein
MLKQLIDAKSDPNANVAPDERKGEHHEIETNEILVPPQKTGRILIIP